MTLQTARRFEDLITEPDPAAPYEYSMLFKADGWGARRRSRNRFKLLKAIDSKLRGILQPQERVYFATPGTTTSVGEQFFVGWTAQFLNMRALVFTTERIILLQTDRRGRPRDLVSQIPYTAIAAVKSTWTGMCRIKLHSGETYNFQRVAGGDRKFLAEFLGDLMKGEPPAFPITAVLEHLCPHCFVHVPEHPDACPACGSGFKSAKKAALLSLLFPGLGDWYLGHRSFACLEFLGAAFFWFSLVFAPLLDPTNPEYGPRDAAGNVATVIILGLMHVIDAVMTRHFALKGHHPSSTAPHRLPAAAAPATH